MCGICMYIRLDKKTKTYLMFEAIDDFIRRFDSKTWKWLCFNTIPRNTLVNYLEVDVPSCLDQNIIERNNGISS